MGRCLTGSSPSSPLPSPSSLPSSSSSSSYDLHLVEAGNDLWLILARVGEWADVMTGSSGEQKLETHNISSRKSGSGSSVSLSRTTLAPFYLQSCGS